MSLLSSSNPAFNSFVENDPWCFELHNSSDDVTYLKGPYVNILDEDISAKLVEEIRSFCDADQDNTITTLKETLQFARLEIPGYTSLETKDSEEKFKLRATKIQESKVTATLEKDIREGPVNLYRLCRRHIRSTSDVSALPWNYDLQQTLQPFLRDGELPFKYNVDYILTYSTQKEAEEVAYNFLRKAELFSYNANELEIIAGKLVGAWWSSRFNAVVDLVIIELINASDQSRSTNPSLTEVLLSLSDPANPEVKEDMLGGGEEEEPEENQGNELGDDLEDDLEDDHILSPWQSRYRTEQDQGSVRSRERSLSS